MSSADALFAMRNSGSSRASAALAGSNEGNGLSVTAMRARGIRSSVQNLRIDAIGRLLARNQRKHVVDDDIGHLPAHLDHRAAEMRGRHHVLHCEQSRRNLGLVL